VTAAKGHRCLGHLEVSADGRLDGWCCLPDRPDHRAVVDIVVDGQAVQSVIATRLRPDLRDLGMGDGYCGFQIPLLARQPQTARVVEARERSLGFVFGRVLLPGDTVARLAYDRMDAVADRLTAAASSLALAHGGESAPLADAFGLLGPTLLRGAVGAASPAGLAAAQRAISRIPHADLGQVARPRLSVITTATAPADELAAALRQAAAALAGLDAEFLLLDDGSNPWASLLPTRLRSLGLIRQQARLGHGALLNAGLCTARGAQLAVLSNPTRLDAHALARLLRTAAPDTVHLGATIGRHLREAGMDEFDDGDADDDLAGMDCVLARDSFRRIGGFTERADDHAAAVWLDFAQRARALGLRLVVWRAWRGFREVGDTARTIAPPNAAA
jgi:hypothetical protein